MAHTDGGSQPEQECHICCSRYDARARSPQLLLCGHRLCAGCLRTMMVLGGTASPLQLRCPFCRRQSPVPGGDTQRPWDGSEGPGLLRCHERGRERGLPEVLLSPSVLQPWAESGDDCLVLTILEVPAAVAPPEALGGLRVVRLQHPGHSPAPKSWARGWRALLGTLCLLCCGSLPLGTYLLLAQHHGLGLAFLCLLPAALLLCASCSLCQCLCRERCAHPSS